MVWAFNLLADASSEDGCNLEPPRDAATLAFIHKISLSLKQPRDEGTGSEESNNLPTSVWGWGQGWWGQKQACTFAQ